MPEETNNSLCYSCISDFTDFQVSADSAKLVLDSGDICLHCFMSNLFKKQSAKFVPNPSRFTKVMAKHILVCFYAPQCSDSNRKLSIVMALSTTFTQCAPEATEFGKITQDKAISSFKVIQGHRFWYQLKAHILLPISD